jgi:hypothetical protein
MTSVSITTSTTCGDEKNDKNEENRRRKGRTFRKNGKYNATESAFAHNNAATK